MPDLASEYFASRGITDPEMMTRLRNAFAANPDILERRMLAGAGRRNARGVDDTFDMMIERTLPEGVVTVGTPEKIENKDVAPAPSPRRPMVNRAKDVAGTDTSVHRESKGSPLQTGGIPGDENAPKGPASESGGSDWMKWLLPLIGIAAARNPIADAGPRGITPYQGPEATYVGPMNRNDPRFGGYLPTNRPAVEGPNPQLNAPDPRLSAPDPRIESRVGPNVESVGNEIDTVNNRNSTMKAAREAQIRQDVADENEAIRRVMEQQERARRVQRGADDTVAAAKRLTGRR